MSSKMSRRQRAEAGIVVFGFFVFGIWYASGQLLYTLHFAYLLARYLFPQWVPEISA
jgi:hypothetical protein